MPRHWLLLLSESSALLPNAISLLIGHGCSGRRSGLNPLTFGRVRQVSATLIGRHSGSTYQRWEPAGNRAGNTPLDPGSNSVNRKCLKRVSCSDLKLMSDQIMTGSLSHTPCTAAATSFWSWFSPSTLTLFQASTRTVSNLPLLVFPEVTPRVLLQPIVFAHLQPLVPANILVVVQSALVQLGVHNGKLS